MAELFITSCERRPSADGTGGCGEAGPIRPGGLRSSGRSQISLDGSAAPSRLVFLAVMNIQRRYFWLLTSVSGGIQTASGLFCRRPERTRLIWGQFGELGRRNRENSKPGETRSSFNERRSARRALIGSRSPLMKVLTSFFLLKVVLAVKLRSKLIPQRQRKKSRLFLEVR